MPEESTRTATVRIITEGIRIQSHRNNIIIVQRPHATILEMEDVLYHHASAVLMPDAPEGPSSNQGRDEEPAQDRITGLEVIRAVYVFLDSNTDKSLILAGHTDRSGPADYNFTLSESRSNSALAVLTGKRQLWIDTVSDKNNVEDWKQILSHYAQLYGWDCDPGPVNNTDDRQGREAIERFKTIYENEFGNPLPPGGEVDPETWGGFFDVYMRELSELMEEAGDSDLSFWRGRLRFLDPAHHYVACGESIPIDSPGLNGLRSQTNRRVEFLFFEDNDAPLIDCPVTRSTTHNRAQCPLYCDMVDHDYIDPTSVVTPQRFRVRFFADTNHTGTVDMSDEEWQQRNRRPGAALVYNCDRDAATGNRLDFEDARIGNDDDLADCSELIVEQSPQLAPECEAFLSISDADGDRIRIYDDYAVNANAVVGRVGSRTITELPLPDIRTRNYTFAVELIDRPRSIATETIRVHVIVREGTIDRSHEYMLFSVAPWLMFSNIEEVEEVYVAVLPGYNDAFVERLDGIFDLRLVRFEEPDNQPIEQWCQDIFEMGVGDTPAIHADPMHQFINSTNARRKPKRRRLYQCVRRQLIGPNCGHITFPTPSSDSLDSFGNLDVTPPLDDYPLGRIYYGIRDENIAFGHAGAEMDEEIINFLHANKFQPPMGIPTNWLKVGHVDEFLSFLPNLNAGATDQPFMLFVASPAKAIELCRTIPEDNRATTMICPGKGTGYEISVADFLSNQDDLLDLNLSIEDIITGIVDTTFRTELGFTDDEIRPIPVIFNGEYYGANWVEAAVARTAGIVNCLVASPDVIIPEPFGPQDSSGTDLFRQCISDEVTALGLNPEFADDWNTYHLWSGEIHCGTNARRVPRDDWQWWDPDLEINGLRVHDS